MKPCEMCGEWQAVLANGMCDDCYEEYQTACDEAERQEWLTVLDLARSV